MNSKAAEQAVKQARDQAWEKLMGFTFLCQTGNLSYKKRPTVCSAPLATQNFAAVASNLRTLRTRVYLTATKLFLKHFS